MFTKLTEIIQILVEGIQNGLKLKKIIDRKRFSLEMLSTYFLFLDICDDGEKLLESVESNLLEQITNISSDDLAILLKIWDTILKKQSIRLYKVQSYVCSNSYIAVFDPNAQKRIEKVIGYKGDQIVTLHGIGANLFLSSIFPLNETPKDIALKVQDVLTMNRNDLLDKNEIKNTLIELRDNLMSFHTIVEKVLTADEIVKYSNIAREQTIVS